MKVKANFERGPFYESTQEELTEIEQKAYEQGKQMLTEAKDQAAKVVETLLFTSTMKKMFATVYQVQRIQALIDGLIRAAKELGVPADESQASWLVS